MFVRIYFKPRTHKQIKPPLIAQILGPYEVNPDEFAQKSYFICLCGQGLNLVAYKI